jgi:nucleoside-diphosphate-sugar epimerase
VGGAKNLVHAMEKYDINRLIFTSTAAVYGINTEVPDENSRIQPFNDYGRSKHKSESVFSKWVKANDRKSLVIVRPTVIFGEKNRGNVYNLLEQIALNRFIMVGKGKNRKSMGYVYNLTEFLKNLLDFGPGEFIYNYADKPDLSTDDLLKITRNALGNNPRINFRIPYFIGLLGGYAFDCLARITGKAYPISSIRIKKFCADTRISAEKAKETGFIAPYSLTDGLKRMISSEFLQAPKRNNN